MKKPVFTEMVHCRQLFFMLFCILILTILFAAAGCARYQFKNDVVTNSIDADGSEVISTSACVLTVMSMREVRDADISLSGDCALNGGANGLGANENAIKMIREIVQKVP